jgi:hypothetical protein
VSSEARPAFYALAPGGWRDYVTLLHPPYTLWHLSYVAIGGALAPRMDWPVLGLTMLAFALALGIGAHALDELESRPLRTRIPNATLVVMAATSIVAAAGIGIAVAASRDLWLLAFVGAGSFLVVAYNLELFGGRFHSDLWFAVSWGAFPVLTGAFAVAERLRADALLAAAAAVFLSLAQRALSTPVRAVRRGGAVGPDTTARLVAPAERALRFLTAATVAVATALLVRHLL